MSDCKDGVQHERIAIILKGWEMVYTALCIAEQFSQISIFMPGAEKSHLGILMVNLAFLWLDDNISYLLQKL